VSARLQNPTFDYKVKYVQVIAAAKQKVGYNYIDETNVTATSLSVKKGMLIGYTTAGGKGVIGTKTPWKGKLDYSRPYMAVAAGTSIKQASFKSEVNKKILLRAILSTPSEIRFYHQYTQANVYNVAIAVTAKAIPAKIAKVRQIKCLEGIDKAPLDVPEIAEAGKATILKVGAHDGKRYV
jgi:hypothetical protein